MSGRAGSPQTPPPLEVNIRHDQLSLSSPLLVAESRSADAERLLSAAPLASDKSRELKSI